MMAEPQRLLAGMLFIVLIAGIATPAFADTTSDIVKVDIAGFGAFTCSFPETAEVPSLIGLGATGCLPTSYPMDFGGGVVVFTEPGSKKISDIFLLATHNSLVCKDEPLCFVSDDDSTALQGILDAIRVEYPGLPETNIEETGTLQDVTSFLGISTQNFRIQVQSDVEPASPVGGEILPLDMTALFVVGIFTNIFWILPTLGGIAGAVIALFKVKRKHI